MLVAGRKMRGHWAAILCGLMLAGCAANDGVVTPTEDVGSADATQQNPDLLGFIFFDHGSARLDNQALSDLRQIAAYHQRTGDRIRVYGHASTRAEARSETQRYLANFRISAQRTQVVTAALERFGVPVNMIWIASVADNWTGSLAEFRAGEAGDRHVVITREPADAMQQAAPTTPTLPATTGFDAAGASAVPSPFAPTVATPTAGTSYQSLAPSLSTAGTVPGTVPTTVPQSVIYQNPAASSVTGGVAGPTEQRHKPYFRR